MIYEDKYQQEQPKKTRNDINTKEQIRKGNFYIDRYRAQKAEMEVREDEWKKLEELYKCDREVIEGAPNSFVPLIAPIVNGQVASMIEQNISAKISGKGYSDQAFARTGQMISDLILKENKIKQVIKIGAKRYVLFGMGCFGVEFDPDAMDGYGLPIIRAKQINKVFVDGNIKDINDFQYGEYVIEEIGFKSIMWARSEYGDDIADFLMMNSSEGGFDAEILDDEKYSFKYLRVWHRNNKNRSLQLLEMDDTGLMLRESEPNTPYYEFVNNKYPYSFFGLYHEEGNFYRFGDGKLLKFMQETLNKLYDEVITACKFSAQGRTYIDPAAECDPDDFDSNPDHPVIAKNPNQNIKTDIGRGINPIVFQMIQHLLTEAQRVSRFSALMSGNAPGEKITATQAGIQTQQGNTGINDKKSDISEALSDMVQYALGMCMEFWDAGMAMRITEGKDDFEWIDAKQLANVPVMVPVDEKYRKEWKNEHPESPESEMPKFMQYVPDKAVKDGEDIIAAAGEPQTKKVSFDINVSIGEGLPSSKYALYQILLSLAQIQVPDAATGKPKTILSYQEIRKFVEDLLGLPLDETLQQAQQIVPPQVQQQSVGMVGNPMIEGASPNGTMNSSVYAY